jgi:hypothetical protein
MTGLIETMARAMWASDPRVNTVQWPDGDVQMKDLYRILATLAVHTAKKHGVNLNSA